MGIRLSRSRQHRANSTQIPKIQQRRTCTQQTTERLQTNKYSFIPDQFKTLDEVTVALRESGLESSNLIVGIDFTKSNEWTGRYAFNGQSLHAIGAIPNPYEQALSIIGHTLSPFDEDNLIPCFGFGDASTHDRNVFSFYEDHRPCNGFDEALSRYRAIVPHLSLAGPTSYAPIIEVAMGIVEKSGGQYHVLVIIADGQVTRSNNLNPGKLSPQEQKTIDAIVAASQYPLSIVLVGVGDGPWETMQQFDDSIPQRSFDNFQFVNFTQLKSRNTVQSVKEADFACSALMEIPSQYKATIELGILGRRVGRVPNIVPLHPPSSIISWDAPMSNFPKPTISQSRPSESTSPVGNSQPETSLDNERQVCPVCLTNPQNLAFGCGHMICQECSQSVSKCPICRALITSRLRVYNN